LRSGVICRIFRAPPQNQENLNGVANSAGRFRASGRQHSSVHAYPPIGKANRKGSFGSPQAVRDHYVIDPFVGAGDDPLKTWTLKPNSFH